MYWLDWNISQSNSTQFNSNWHNLTQLSDTQPNPTQQKQTEVYSNIFQTDVDQPDPRYLNRIKTQFATIAHNLSQSNTIHLNPSPANLTQPNLKQVDEIHYYST